MTSCLTELLPKTAVFGAPLPTLDEQKPLKLFVWHGVLADERSGNEGVVFALATSVAHAKALIEEQGYMDTGKDSGHWDGFLFDGKECDVYDSPVAFAVRADL